MGLSAANRRVTSNGRLAFFDVFGRFLFWFLVWFLRRRRRIHFDRIAKGFLLVHWTVVFGRSRLFSQKS